MVRTLVVRGLAVGLIAGLAAGLFGLAIGEPRIDDAIEIEKAASAIAAVGVHLPVADHGTVSRGTQHVGLVLATTLYGLAIGGCFGLAYAVCLGRTGPRDPWWLAVAVAVVGFAALVLVPALKYPANPPAVGDPDDITRRTLLWGVLVLCALASVVAAVRAGRLAARWTPWGPPVAGAATFVLCVALALAGLPAATPTPHDFPADLLWDFRVAALGTQAVLWAVLGTVFGIHTTRALQAAAR